MDLPCMYSFHAASCILHTFAARSPLVPLIDTLEWLSIGILVDTWSILNWHLGQESPNFPSMHTSRSTFGWLSTEHLSSVSQDVNQVLIECRPTIDCKFIEMSTTHAHNAFSTHDFSYIELCKKLIHVSWSIHDCQSCVRETREIVLLLLYYYYYAWLHCKYLCMLLQWQFGIKFMNYKTNVLLAC